MQADYALAAEVSARQRTGHPQARTPRPLLGHPDAMTEPFAADAAQAERAHLAAAQAEAELLARLEARAVVALGRRRPSPHRLLVVALVLVAATACSNGDPATTTESQPDATQPDRGAGLADHAEMMCGETDPQTLATELGAPSTDPRPSPRRTPRATPRTCVTWPSRAACGVCDETDVPEPRDLGP